MNGHSAAQTPSEREVHIPCTIHKLSQLIPAIIQSHVPKAVFGSAYQYFAQRRVLVIYASEKKIVAEVEGAGAVHQQTIRLTDGKLVAVCSCHSDEQPWCRHCIAALLAYQRLVPDYQPEQDGTLQGTGVVFEGGAVQDWLNGQATEPESSLATGLHETTVFIEWLQAAVAALKKEEPLPAVPNLGAGDAAGWACAIQKLAEHARFAKVEMLALQREVDMKEEQRRSMAHELDAAKRQVAETQQAYDAMKRELQACRDLANKLIGAEHERERVVVAIGERADGMMNTISEIDRLISMLRSGSNGTPVPLALSAQ